ncbi:uncharacterized protein LOC117503556 [Thalassophryne amazonica]|uniref:uncharacterized protein LOC117503556 n=1 Tax=Thalassophryne amazonica TaxID=390379 RepID=UPI001471CAAE|nr:uncharacterized protein LOC117503556 [Thalassophryne amazonica]
MEPVDTAKNDDSAGLSKPRISSILKVPQRSVLLSDLEQVENLVECVKPAEKRTSKRVSFALSNDVLFSKEVKSVSSQSQLQVLNPPASEASKENRLQVAVAGEMIQHRSGMETLLNAPLHASQQRDQVYFDTEQDYGDKTVMFAADDAFMDMTHSHTINLASDPELRAENLGILPTRREKMMPTGDDGSLGMTKTLNEPVSHSVIPHQKFNLLPTGKSVDYSIATGNKNTSSLRPDLDPGFKNFLASLCKPSGPVVNPVIARVGPNAAASGKETTDTNESPVHLSAEVDKENQAPPLISALKRKSLNQTRMTRERPELRTLCPEGEVSVDKTKAHSGCVSKTEAMDAADTQTGQTEGVTDADDPFRCLFAIQDNEVSQRAEKVKASEQSGTTRGSFSLKALETNRFLRLVGQEAPQSSDVKTLNLPLQACQQRHMVDLGRKDERRDTTQKPNSESQLRLSTNGSLTKLNTQRPGGHNESLFPASTSTVMEKLLNATKLTGGSSSGGGHDQVEVDMTNARTGKTLAITGTGRPLQCLLPTKDLQPHCDTVKAEMTSEHQSSAARWSSSPNGMETFSSESLNKLEQRHQVKLDGEERCEDKTVRFSADNACMDVTRSYTVNIDKYLESQFITTDHCDSLPTHGARKVTFHENDRATNISQCHTGDQKRHAQSKVVGLDQSCNLLPTHKEKMMRKQFYTNDESMDITQCHTLKERKLCDSALMMDPWI